MKAVNCVMMFLLALVFIGKPVWAQETTVGQSDSLYVEDMKNEVLSETTDDGAAFAQSAVMPYEGFLQANEEITGQVDALTADRASDVEPALVDTANELVAGGVDEVSQMVQDVEETVEAVKTETASQAGGPTDTALLEAVKADIKERSKTTGRLDLYDGSINKVRTLDLIEYKTETTSDGETTLVRGDFRDTASGDVVSLDIHVLSDKGKYGIKDMVIASVAKPEVKEAKSEYTDEEIKGFIQEYIETQSQATGTFDLYDEKAKKMRNLQFVSLDEKLRRYGIIGIATAEFTDKNSGDVVKVDVNTDNKNGLSVTAMRLKSVSKPAVKE